MDAKNAQADRREGRLLFERDETRGSFWNPMARRGVVELEEDALGQRHLLTQ